MRIIAYGLPLWKMDFGEGRRAGSRRSTWPGWTHRGPPGPLWRIGLEAFGSPHMRSQKVDWFGCKTAPQPITQRTRDWCTTMCYAYAKAAMAQSGPAPNLV